MPPLPPPPATAFCHHPLPTTVTTPPCQVVESHQRTKADTSGTAKAVVASFNKMGLPYEEVGPHEIREIHCLT